MPDVSRGHVYVKTGVRRAKLLGDLGVFRMQLTKEALNLGAQM